MASGLQPMTVSWALRACQCLVGFLSASPRSGPPVSWRRSDLRSESPPLLGLSLWPQGPQLRPSSGPDVQNPAQNRYKDQRLDEKKTTGGQRVRNGVRTDTTKAACSPSRANDGEIELALDDDHVTPAKTCSKELCACAADSTPAFINCDRATNERYSKRNTNQK